MPSTQVTLVRAVEVEVDKLGASLEAYDRLQPTIFTLRLCNRFGHGEKAAFTKLPTELVQQVEDILMRHERDKQLSDWAQDFECWQTICEPSNHYNDEEILDWYQKWQEDVKRRGEDCEDDDELCYGPGAIRVQDKVQAAGPHEVTAHMREWLNHQLEDDYPDTNGERWLEKHEKRVKEWCERVGHPAAARHGKFEKLAEVLYKNFGLKVWISHFQQPGTCDFTEENVAQSTKAYVYLPSGFSRKQVWDLRVDDYPVARPLPTEAGIAYAVKLPRKQPKATLDRFRRSLENLGLETVAEPQASSCSEPIATVRGETPRPTTPRLVKSDFKPALTLLVRNCDEIDWSDL